MHQRHSIFTIIRKQSLTNKNMLRPLQDEEDANQFVNSFSQTCFLFFGTGDPEHKENAAFYATKLKQLALRGVRTAVNFYRGLFFNFHEMSSNIPSCNYSILHKVLLNHVKEIALRTNDAYLLFYSYPTRIYSPSARNLEEAFNCLMAAAKMEGDYATKSAYCLAYLYGKELVNVLKLTEYREKVITDQNLVNTFSSLLSWIKNHHATPKMSLNEILQYLKTLAHFGSKEAHQYLAYLYKGEENKQIDSILAIYLQEMKASPKLVDYHTKEAEKLADNNYLTLKERFSYYFNLAFEKSMELNSVEIFYTDGRGYVFTLNLDELIKLDMLINQENEHNQKMYQDAAAGKLGAMHIMCHDYHFNEASINPMLEKIISSESTKNNDIIVRAARMLYNRQKTTKQLENAARLGCTTSMVELGVQAFHCDLPQAMHYFKQAIMHDQFYNIDRNIRETIFFALHTQPLDTTDKIEFYFQLAADMVKELTNPRRFTCLLWIHSTLKARFSDANNRPHIINEWLKIKFVNSIHVSNLPSAIQLSDTAKQLDAAFNEIADIVKTTLPAVPSCRPVR